MFIVRSLAFVALSLSPTAWAQDAIYAVFEVTDGTAHLVSATSAPDAIRQPVGGSGPEQVDVRVLDGDDALTFITTASGGTLRGEFHGAPLPNGGHAIDGHHLHASSWSFAVRLPRSDLAMDGTVEVALTSGTQRRGAPLRVPVADLLAQTATPVRRASTVQRLFGDGDSGNRIDLLVVGDGYTRAEQATFFADATGVASAFLDIRPYLEYKPAFNATALFVASAESGADQPNSGSCVGNGQMVDTAFDATYCTSNIDRLLTVNSSKVYTAAAAMPEWDLILVIVNDTKYGGAGGGISVISMHNQAVDLARHEVGHTFGGLADEYTYGTPRSCTEPNCPPNVTPSPQRAALKWAPWVDASTPLPTPDSPAYNDAVGAFEGAYYTTTGMYRPHRNCMMRALGVPFCPI
ncbi:MAG: M64 family metallopeptidase, partial [Bacteroidota bacterium]